MIKRLRCGVRIGRQDRLDLCVWNDEDPRNVGINPQLHEGCKYSHVHRLEISTRKTEQCLKLDSSQQ